ncbi:MAG TPA: class I SAM-dependent methyltransferase, partial [Longimicrobiaceae bacterium]|nr:class I SAM-dependent methyltransferase [Longimicrobiaceae bacterium]
MLLGIQLYASRVGARLYDHVMAPLERRLVGGWRRRTWVEVPSGGLGLEVGAGTGANFEHHPTGARVIAMDRSLEMLQRAKKRRAGSSVALVVADAEALPFRDGAFDWAAETLVFCEVTDPEQGFREMARVVRPGGPLILLEHVRPAGWLGRVADALTTVMAP